ncbi:hypothetical protein [Streptomyces canus]|uniref:hypothetical protein n=1 Tax=Streptomyces canus TaxID=58343 RepID=UPI00386874DD|nr:hypothetical protein OH824_37595 [Streptomyces canus]
MNPIARSPFGPAAEQHCNIKAHAELVLLDENVKNLSKALVQEYRKETAKYQHLAEIERDARREAEIRARSYAKVIDQHDDLKAKLESMIPDLVQEVQHLPKEPEVPELEAQLRAAEKERDGLAELLRAAEEERDAALRARDAAHARLRPRQADGIVVGDAEALQLRLDAPTLRGVLEQAKRYCTLLVITADPDEAERLEHHQKASLWRDRLADALAMIQAYAEDKNLTRVRGRGAGPDFANLRAYCGSRPSPLLSPVKVILNEGKFASSSPRGKADRRLRVPEDIDPSGYAAMLEHIRIGDGAPPAPRLHYLDDTDQSGLIVVGFFGEHLHNASTN